MKFFCTYDITILSRRNHIVLVAAKGLISIDQQKTLGLISIDHSHNVHKRDEAFFEMLINGDEA
jgi:hypothetical protein